MMAWLLLCVITLNALDFKANYVESVEDRSILCATIILLIMAIIEEINTAIWS